MPWGMSTRTFALCGTDTLPAGRAGGAGAGSAAAGAGSAGAGAGDGAGGGASGSGAAGFGPAFATSSRGAGLLLADGFAPFVGRSAAAGAGASAGAGGGAGSGAGAGVLGGASGAAGAAGCAGAGGTTVIGPRSLSDWSSFFSPHAASAWTASTTRAIAWAFTAPSILARAAESNPLRRARFREVTASSARRPALARADRLVQAARHGVALAAKFAPRRAAARLCG